MLIACPNDACARVIAFLVMIVLVIRHSGQVVTIFIMRAWQGHEKQQDVTYGVETWHRYYYPTPTKWHSLTDHRKTHPVHQACNCPPRLPQPHGQRHTMLLGHRDTTLSPRSRSASILMHSIKKNIAVMSIVSTVLQIMAFYDCQGPLPTPALPQPTCGTPGEDDGEDD
jgi:hypothetical protein